MKPYSEDLIIPKIRELKVDYFGALLDSFMVFPFWKNLDFGPAKSFFYFPSDGEGGLPVNCETVLRHVHQPVAMSKFAQKQVKDLYNIDSLYIPHAVDTKNYYPLSEEARKNIRENFICYTIFDTPIKGFLKDKFVVGSVARNQGRKMLDRTIKIASKFCRMHDDVVFLLHLDPNDLAQVFDIKLLIQRHGIQNKVVFTGMSFYKGFDYKQMNDVYNIMDVFILTTSGEGFGIPTIEAMACKVPVLITDFTTTKELITDWQAGEVIKFQTDVTGAWSVERAICDIEDGVLKLDKLYNDKSLRTLYGENGLKAVLKEYNWIVVGNQWYDFINKL